MSTVQTSTSTPRLAPAALLAGVLPDHGEPRQVLRHGVGGEYRPHHEDVDPDSPGSQEHLRDGEKRIVTKRLRQRPCFQ